MAKGQKLFLESPGLSQLVLVKRAEAVRFFALREGRVLAASVS